MYKIFLLTLIFLNISLHGMEPKSASSSSSSSLQQSASVYGMEQKPVSWADVVRSNSQKPLAKKKVADPVIERKSKEVFKVQELLVDLNDMKQAIQGDQATIKKAADNLYKNFPMNWTQDRGHLLDNWIQDRARLLDQVRENRVHILKQLTSLEKTALLNNSIGGEDSNAFEAFHKRDSKISELQHYYLLSLFNNEVVEKNLIRMHIGSSQQPLVAQHAQLLSHVQLVSKVHEAVVALEEAKGLLKAYSPHAEKVFSSVTNFFQSGEIPKKALPIALSFWPCLKFVDGLNRGDIDDRLQSCKKLEDRLLSEKYLKRLIAYTKMRTYLEENPVIEPGEPVLHIRDLIPDKYLV